ncbi:MAG: Gfo/Idh/MocA family oxidoreductase [candidate division Zixibacteria bacterium]|nr:Gfo/Idh/MocA family oxidoreductase [candidate division Zixibacteria bacterium]
MSGRKTRIGIIGVGRIAMAHFDAAMELKDQLVELVAIADVRADRAREIADKFKVKSVYGDYHELLKDPEVEAVIVCLPNFLHHRVCRDAAKAKKHILVEKPMAMNLTEADEMIEAAQENQVTLMVGQSRRFSDAIKEVRRRMDEIGPPFRMDISFLVSFPQPPTDWWKSSEKAGGLVILLQGSHSIDTILWLLNKTPSTVFSISRSRNPLWEGEDEADIFLGFDSGELATVHLSLSTLPYLHETIIVGPKGTMRLFEFPTEKTFGFSYRLEINGKTVLDGEQIPSLYTVQLKEFVGSIRENRLPTASGEEVRKTMLVLDQVRKSDREGGVLHLTSSIA